MVAWSILFHNKNPERRWYNRKKNYVTLSRLVCFLTLQVKQKQQWTGHYMYIKEYQLSLHAERFIPCNFDLFCFGVYCGRA